MAGRRLMPLLASGTMVKRDAACMAVDEKLSLASVSGWQESVQDLAQAGAAVSQQVHSVACTAGTLASAQGVASAGERSPPTIATIPKSRPSRASVEFIRRIISMTCRSGHHD